MDNESPSWGGAIAAYSSGDMLIINCEIHGNKSYGGAVSVATNARVTIIGSDVSDNAATHEGADANGVLPSDVKAPKGTGASRFFRVKVTDDPSVVR